MLNRRQPATEPRRGAGRKAAAALSLFSLIATGLVAVPLAAQAADEPASYRLVGSLQNELGCAADWEPACEDGLLTAAEGGMFALTAPVPAGDYEFKVLAGDSWESQAWGRGGATGPDAANIRLTTEGDATLQFVFDPETGRTTVVPTDDPADPTEADALPPVRQAQSDERFYFVLTDRFANGDTTNDTGGIDGDRLDHGFDPTDKGFYHGGDLAGLREKLDYIEGLGTTAIWLTPSFKNMPVQGTGDDISAGYHGYWITDFTQIDPHLGENAELKALIDEAHAKGIKVYFDIITNHTADVIQYAEGEYTYRDTSQEPYTPVVPDGLENVKVPSWLNDPARYNNRGNSTWEGESAILGDFDGLDDLDTTDPEVVDGFIDIYEAWVDFGIDGFRIDTAKHVDFSFWEQWTAAIEEYVANDAVAANDGFFTFGEVYDADPVKLSRYLRDTDMDAVLDFTFQDRVAGYVKGGTAKGLANLFAGDDYYTTADKSAHSLPTFVGNHDMGRVGYFVKDSTNPEDRSALAHSLMYLTRGQPVVYYGDEQGFVGAGGNDKSARQSLFASEVDEYTEQTLLDGTVAGSQDRFDTDTALYQHIAELAALRESHEALATGAQVEQFVADGAGVYAFSRVAGADGVEYLVAANNATEPGSATFTALTPSATFAGIHGTDGSVTSTGDGTVTLEVPALSTVVLRAETEVVADAAIAPTFTTPAMAGGVKGLQQVVVDLETDRYAETTLSYRVAGATAWTPLGVDDTTTPRVFHDVSDMKPGTLLQYRAVVRDADGNLTQATTFASVGDEHGGGTPVEADPSTKLTIPGDHGVALGCSNWEPGCEASALTQRANGSYAGTFDIPAGTYNHKYAFGNDWSDNYGAGGVHNSAEDNIKYTHAGGPITFFFDPDTKLGANTASGPVYTVAGDFQDQLGCVSNDNAGNWSDSCLGSLMQRQDDGTLTLTLADLTPGSYEAKAIENLSWDTAFGGEGGANVPFTVTAENSAVTFAFDPTTQILTATTGATTPEEPEEPGEPAGPTPIRTDITVSVPGSLNSEMGCAADWSPDCTQAQLTEQVGSVHYGTFDLPAGSYEYKAAINGSWDENYGVARTAGSGNVPLVLAEDAEVTFVYDDASHFVQAFYPGAETGRLAVVAGSLQAQMGCSADWDPACLGSWLQNYERDGGVYQLVTDQLTAGSYEAKAAFGLSWDEAYPGSNVGFTVPKDYATMIFRFDSATGEFTAQADDSVPGEGQRAYWLDARTLAVPSSAGTDDGPWTLHSAPEGGLGVASGAVTTPDGAASFPLTQRSTGLPDDLRGTYPHLAAYDAFELGADVTRDQIEAALQGQLLVTQAGADGVTYATGVQIAGVLDDVFAAALDRDLGVTWDGDTPTLALWAPTARSVTTQVWLQGAGTATGPVTEREATRNDDGTWVTQGTPYWKNMAYKYVVEVYVPSTGKVERNAVTDPYSVALTLNSTHSVLVDLADAAYQPDVWRTTPAPVIERDVDRSIYELHIRDFSITDESVPAEQRGTYLAFAGEGDGVKHLRELAAAGLNTVHLLPSFDIATIEEDRSKQQTTGDLSEFGPAGTEQQAAVAAIANEDGFNWGYDPLHYTAPEGSYASTGNQDGGARVAEYRTMVGALHKNGLQVVQDVVYNHTAAAGQAEKSVLDKVVPGYYQRLSATGGVETSTCCSNVATENAFAEKLMVDSVVTWATQYKIDGFRFDLMGHHSKANMLAVRAALDELTVAEHGVDGSAIYLYGEGWNFGEVADNARFEQATQGQLGGTGIGTFSDRLRDAVHGGSPVDGSSTFTQGYGTGLGTDPNGREASTGNADSVNDGSPDELADLALQSDLVRLGLAGNLRDFTFVTSAGAEQRGDEIDYRGAPAGYADSPEEVITYVDAHDNETLFDLLTLKLPVATSMADRVRMNTLSLATTALSQTPSFWHAGTDLLRSKSLDRDSYNSGDHFNAIDWTGQDNNFGAGLPIAEKNEEKWPLMKPLLENPALKPTPADIATAEAAAKDLLKLRYSTPLLRLGSADLIQQKVTFPGSGAEATPGLILMHVDDLVGADVDPDLTGALVVFNASPDTITETSAELAGRSYVLSDVQRTGSDPVVKQTTWDAASGAVTIPARTVALLVEHTVAPGDPGDPGDPDPEPVDPAPSTTTVTPRSVTARAGEPVSFTVRVAADGAAATGTVQIRRGTKVFGSGTLRDGKVTVTLRDATTRAGWSKYRAYYLGSKTVAPSSSALLKVRTLKAKATVQIKPVRSTMVVGSRAKLDVRVQSTGDADGKIRVRERGRTIAIAKVRDGRARVVLPRSFTAKPGTHRLEVTYYGSSTVAKAKGKAKVSVRKATPSLAVRAVRPSVWPWSPTLLKVHLDGDGVRPTGRIAVSVDGKRLFSTTVRTRSDRVTYYFPVAFGARGERDVKVVYSGSRTLTKASATTTVRVR